MKYQRNPRKKLSKKAIAFFVCAAVALTVLLVGLILWLSTVIFSHSTGDKSLTQMPFSADAEYACVGTNIVYLNQQVLTCIDGRLKEIWKCSIDPGSIHLNANDAVIVAYGDEAIQCIDKNGTLLFATRIDGQVQSARAGINKVAVYVRQVLEGTTPAYILVFDLAGNSLYQIDVMGKYVLDYGFDSQSDQLYMLELDVTGSVPISRISTFRPETQAMTGIKELKDQLVTGVRLIGKDIYAMGTGRLTVYPAANTGSSRDIQTYGWMPADFNASTEIKFVYVPAKEGPIDIVRIIRPSGAETKINLPPGVFGIIATDEKIYCFANSSYFVYTKDGKFLRTYELGYAADSVQRAIPGYVFLTQGSSVALMKLP